MENFDIELDQSRYCKSIIKKYLETAGCAKVIRQHDMPIPSGFIPRTNDCCITDEERATLSTELNLYFASCIGSLMYQSITRSDIILQ